MRRLGPQSLLDNRLTHRFASLHKTRLDGFGPASDTDICAGDCKTSDELRPASCSFRCALSIGIHEDNKPREEGKRETVSAALNIRLHII